MKRLDNVEIYHADTRGWIVSNVWDEAENFFFQEVFVKTDPSDAGWSRVGAYFIDDAEEEVRVRSSIKGERRLTEIGSGVLPAPVRPDTHDRTVDMAVHLHAARSAPKWLGKLSNVLRPQ